mmetsp:Transcript_44426/g.102676  ORF Transcript_44426/g.102676 Transcript_44426/m.102676 type:complete len:290 (+) Transcript_44426:545-1414(+)
MRMLHTRRDGETRNLCPPVLVDEGPPTASRGPSNNAGGQANKGQLTIVLVQIADAGFIIHRSDCCLHLVHVRPRLRLVHQSHDKSSLDTSLKRTYRLQAIVLGVKRCLAVTEDTESTTSHFIGPKGCVLYGADHQDLLTRVGHRHLLQARNIVPPPCSDSQRFMTSRRSDLTPWNDNGCHLPVLLLLADVHTPFQAAIDCVAQFQPCFAWFVQPRHEQVVQTAQMMGPVQELWAHQVLPPLERPAHSVMMTACGCGQVADEEHLVVLLLRLHGQLHALDRCEAVRFNVC